ncbi:MarR family winged helix-turn-helix transcriptional regulator [Cryptosporangium sp. NPDC048952]|uniref:MarR family winged helix-turn-helix transcriptional regulator n=1 Tax=Cryptosporangium sp. NPDC048952 TaxID=3363961 RepID=UPI003714B46B
MDDSAVRAARDVQATFSRLRRRWRDEIDVRDLTPSQTSVLLVLGKEGPASGSALAAKEGVRPQSMAATLSALEAQGLVRRDLDPGDGRRQVVSLSAAGRSWFDGSRSAREEWLVVGLRERLSEDERRTVIAAMALLDRAARPSPS